MGDAAPLIAVGATVECRFATTPRWRAARVEALHDGRYVVRYADAAREAERDVVRRRLRAPGQRQRRALARGERVDARSAARGGAYLPGAIVAADRAADRFAVRFDDDGKIFQDVEVF